VAPCNGRSTGQSDQQADGRQSIGGDTEPSQCMADAIQGRINQRTQPGIKHR
jgi:hypothetical protein